MGTTLSLADCNALPLVGEVNRELFPVSGFFFSARDRRFFLAGGERRFACANRNVEVQTPGYYQHQHHLSHVKDWLRYELYRASRSHPSRCICYHKLRAGARSRINQLGQWCYIAIIIWKLKWLVLLSLVYAASYL